MRFNKTSIICFVVLIFCLVYLCLQGIKIDVNLFYDTSSYLGTKSSDFVFLVNKVGLILALWNKLFIVRPFLLPVVYSLFSLNFVLLFSTAVNVFSIIYFSYICVNGFTHKQSLYYKKIIFIVLVFFIFSNKILFWNNYFLSESLSFSMTFLFIARLLILNTEVKNYLVFLIVGLFFLAARDTNIGLFIFCIPIVFFKLRRDLKSLFIVIFCLCCMCFFQIITASLGGRGDLTYLNRITYELFIRKNTFFINYYKSNFPQCNHEYSSVGEIYLKCPEGLKHISHISKFTYLKSILQYNGFYFIDMLKTSYIYFINKDSLINPRFSFISYYYYNNLISYNIYYEILSFPARIIEVFTPFWIILSVTGILFLKKIKKGFGQERNFYILLTYLVMSCLINANLAFWGDGQEFDRHVLIYFELISILAFILFSSTMNKCWCVCNSLCKRDNMGFFNEDKITKCLLMVCFFFILAGVYIRLKWGCIVHTIQVSDFNSYINNAYKIMNGQSNFSVFPSQFGFAYLLSFWGKLIGLEYYDIVFFNVVSYVLIILITSYIIYFWSRSMVSVLIYILIFTFLPSGIVYSSVAASENLSILFFMVYLLFIINWIKSNQIKYLIIATFSLWVANFIRPMFFAYGILSLIVMLFEFRRIFKGVIILCAIYFVFCYIISHYIFYKFGIDITANVLGNSILIGSNHLTLGVYNQIDADQFFSWSKYYGYNKATLLSFETAIQRYSFMNLFELFKFLCDKVNVAWRYDSYPLYWSTVGNQSVDVGFSKNIIYVVMNWFYYFLITLFIFFILIRFVFLKQIKVAGSFLMVTLIFFTFLYLLIVEVQERYHFIGVYFIIIFNSLMLGYFSKKIMK